MQKLKQNSEQGSHIRILISEHQQCKRISLNEILSEPPLVSMLLRSRFPEEQAVRRIQKASWQFLAGVWHSDVRLGHMCTPISPTNCLSKYITVPGCFLKNKYEIRGCLFYKTTPKAIPLSSSPMLVWKSGWIIRSWTLLWKYVGLFL